MIPARSSLALPRKWLVAALALASLFPGWALLRALSLSVYFESTEEALYAAGVGRSLRAPAAGAMVFLGALAVGVRVIAPMPSRLLTAGVAVTIAATLGVTGAAWVNADRALNPFGAELRAMAAFVPPPGAERGHDRREATDHPVVT